MVLMDKLVSILDSEALSCVIYNRGDSRHFTQRGVADLHQISTEEPNFLNGAMVADKVVGKGAAAFMAKYGVKELYTHTISEGAYNLLALHGVKVGYGTIVPHIKNRAGDGWCPIEKICCECDDLDEILTLIEGFIERQKLLNNN